MKNSFFTASRGSSVIALALFFQVAPFAAQDHNSSRSNKTSSIAAPSDSGAVEMKAKEKANRTKSMTADGSQEPSAEIAIGDPGVNGIAIDEGGTPKVKGGKGHTTRKAFVLPHVLEKSGTVSAQPCDPNTADCGTTTSADHAINTKGTGTGGITEEPPTPQEHAITEKGLPSGPVKGSK